MNKLLILLLLISMISCGEDKLFVPKSHTCYEIIDATKNAVKQGKKSDAIKLLDMVKQCHLVQQRIAYEWHAELQQLRNSCNSNNELPFFPPCIDGSGATPCVEGM